MAHKRLSVKCKHTIHDTVIEKLLKAAKIPKGAIKLVRDCRGRVIQIIIHLPASVIERIKAIIALIKDFYGLEEAEIAEGEQGLDGTAASITALEDAGFVRTDYSDAPVMTFDEDTMTYSTSSSTSVTYWYGYGACPSSPLPFDVEIKIKTPNGSQNCLVDFANDLYGAQISLAGGSTGVNILSVNEYTEQTAEVAIDDQFHVIKASLSDTGLLTVLYDNVEKISYQLTPRVGLDNYVSFALASQDDRYAVLDYVTWTQRP